MSHRLGRFQPCVGPCCVPPNCQDCGDWFNASPTWVDLPALTDGSCDECASAERTIALTQFLCAGEAPGYTAVLCGFWMNYFRVGYTVINGQCYLLAEWFDQFSFPPPYVPRITWRLPLSSPASPLDHEIPFYEEDNAYCSGVGTVVRVYQ